MSYTDEVLADNPTVYFKFEDNLANLGSATATQTGAPAAYVASPHGKGADFNGSAGITLSSTVSNAFGNVNPGTTFEFWIKTTDTGASFIADMDADGANQYKVQMYYGNVRMERLVNGFSYNTTSLATINDNQWHHIVAVFNTAAFQIYIDGALDRSVSSTFKAATFANPILAIGKGVGAATASNIMLDEFAVYPTSLTAARAAAHYAAPSAVGATVDVPTAQVTGQTYEPAYAGPVTNIAVQLDTATATSQAVEADVEAQYVYSTDVSPTADYRSTFSGDTNPMTFTNISQKAVFLMDLPNEVTRNGMRSVKFRVQFGSRSAINNTFALRTLTAPVDVNGSPTAISAGKVNIGKASGTYDITSIVDFDNFYGVVMVVDTGTDVNEQVYSQEDANTAYRPLLTVTYEVVSEPMEVALHPALATLAALEATAVIPVAVDLDTPASFAQAGEVGVDTQTQTVVAVPAAGMSLAAPDAKTAQEIVDLDAAVVTFEAPSAEGSIPVIVDVDVAEGITVQSYEAEQSVAYNAINNLDTPKIWVTKKELESVNGDPIVHGEDEDPYFNAVMLSDPTIWYRFNDLVNPVKARVGYSEATGAVNIVNGVVGQNGGIGDRKYVYFNGTAYFAQPGLIGGEDEQYSYDGTLTFAVRTTKNNQFLMRMDDRYYPEGGLFSQRLGAWDLSIVNGKVELRGVNGDVVFTSFATVADGNWHQIALTSERDRPNDNYSTGRINLYIDGELDIRRYKSAGVSFPDYIGGMPSLTDQTKWFVGDMTEVALFKNNYFTQDEVYRHYDTLIGRDPVYLESAKIKTNAPDVDVKGNKPTVLVLDFSNFTGRGTYTKDGVEVENDDFVRDGQATTQTFSFPGFGPRATDLAFNSVTDPQHRGLQNPRDAHDMLIYTISVFNGGWFDERLDVPRYVDLEKDLNMDDYDVISIINYPQDSGNVSDELVYNYGVEFGGLTFTQQRERLMEQVRQQVVAGKSLFITDPRSAVELGIVDKVDYVPSYREGRWLDHRLGSVTGLFDAFYAGKHRPAGELDAAARYDDQHANMFQRVRNLVPGLTDVPGYHIHTDSAKWRNVDPFGTPNTMRFYKYEDRTDTGLLLDDEFYLIGNGSMDRLNDDTSRPSFTRVGGWLGVPLANIKAGVAVTTFGTKLGMMDKMIDNPYKDHAVSIAVRPGDPLKGDTIAGKVYVNFVEDGVNWAAIADQRKVQIIPENGKSPDGRFTATDRYWDYAETGDRGLYTGDTITFSAPIEQSNSNWDSLNMGEQTTAGRKGSNKKMFVWKWAMMTFQSAFPMENIYIAPMARRGLDWLVGDIEEDGNAAAGVQAAKATTGANDVTVETTQTVEVTVGTARLTTDAEAMPDVTEADATVLVNAPTLTLRAQEFMEIVDLDAASITLNAPEVENDILNSVDRIWVTMPVDHNITLILEEE